MSASIITSLGRPPCSDFFLRAHASEEHMRHRGRHQSSSSRGPHRSHRPERVDDRRGQRRREDQTSSSRSSKPRRPETVEERRRRKKKEALAARDKKRKKDKRKRVKSAASFKREKVGIVAE